MSSINGKFDHWTEFDGRVVAYVNELFGDKPEKQRDGADLIVGGIRIEVKACNEWNRTSYANGTRRRGRFQLMGYENCDFFLFVLVRANGDIDMSTYPADTIGRRFGVVSSVSWSHLFAN